MATIQSTKPVEWRPVVGWEGFYEVSNTGRVRSIGRTLLLRNGAVRTFPSQELSLSGNDCNYPCVHLRNMSNGRRRTAMVHRLVAIAFIPNPDGKPCVNHVDADVTNACVENLEWCSQRENLAHARSLGRMPNTHQTGRRSPNAKLSDDAVRELRAIYQRGGVSWEALGKQFGVSKRCAGRIIMGEVYADVR